MSPVASFLVAFLLISPAGLTTEAGTPLVVEFAVDSSGSMGDVAPGIDERQPLVEAHRAPMEAQVRVEQRTTIRITPHAAAPVPPVMLPPPRAGMPPRVEERRMGKCLPMSGIAGVRAESDHRLLLFMRDRRIISAELEKACRARDFYSGFYVERNADGQICIDRDKLQSRAGANCSLTRLRQLIVADD